MPCVWHKSATSGCEPQAAPTAVMHLATQLAPHAGLQAALSVCRGKAPGIHVASWQCHWHSAGSARHSAACVQKVMQLAPLHVRTVHTSSHAQPERAACSVLIDEVYPAKHPVLAPASSSKEWSHQSSNTALACAPTAIRPTAALVRLCGCKRDGVPCWSQPPWPLCDWLPNLPRSKRGRLHQNAQQLAAVRGAAWSLMQR